MQLQPTRLELAPDARPIEHVARQDRPFAGVPLRHQLVETRSCAGGIAVRRYDAGDRIAVLAVPVGIEGVGQVRNDRARSQHVEVDEVGRGAGHEVLVADVAPAAHRQRVVGDEQLVVHAVVDAAELVQRRQHTLRRRAGARGQWIEQPHLDIGVGREVGEHDVVAGGVEIVDQQAHAHAARRRVAQLAQEAVADRIAVHLVVLRIDRSHGAARQRQARVERIVAGGQDAKARQAALRLGVDATTRRASGVSPVSVNANVALRATVAGRKAQPCSTHTSSTSHQATGRQVVWPRAGGCSGMARILCRRFGPPSRMRSTAGVVQWQDLSFPSSRRGFDSHRPLHTLDGRKARYFRASPPARGCPTIGAR